MVVACGASHTQDVGRGSHHLEGVAVVADELGDYVLRRRMVWLWGKVK